METAIGDVLAWVLFVGIGVLGLASCGVATVHVYRWLRRRAGSARVAVPVAGVIAILMFLGLWIVADLYWLSRWGPRRLAKRHSVGAG